jgi:DNA polymerase-3 subunit gamma/tau
VAKNEKIEAEPEALHLIAQKADGALRDALSFFDMIVTFSADNKVTLETTLHNLQVLDYDYYFRITEYLLQENTSDTLLTLEEILSKGFDSHNFINGLSEHLRTLLVGKDPDTIQLMEVSDSVKQRYLQQCQQTSMSFLLTALNICNQCDLSYKNSKTPRLHVEIALMKMAHLPSAVQLAADQVKKKTFSTSGVIRDESQAPGAESQAPNTKHQAPGAESQALSDKHQAPGAKRQALSATPKKTGKLPSIKALKSNVSEVLVAESGPETSKPKRAESFDKKDLLRYWQEFAEDRRKEGKKQEILILSQEPVIVDELTVQIKLNSSVQIDTVDRLKSDLLPFLRDKLQNDGLKLEAELEMDESKRVMYTPSEKFKYLAEKHPALKVLQEKLGLDPDF